MNKERFKYTNYDDGSSSIYDRKKDEYYFDCDLEDISEILNNFSEENRQLIKDNQTLLKHCETHKIIVPLDYNRYKQYIEEK